MDEFSVRVVPPGAGDIASTGWDLIRSWSRQFFGSHPLSARLTWVAKEGVRYRVLVYSGQKLVSHLRIKEQWKRIRRGPLFESVLYAFRSRPLDSAVLCELGICEQQRRGDARSRRLTVRYR